MAIIAAFAAALFAAQVRTTWLHTQQFTIFGHTEALGCALVSFDFWHTVAPIPLIYACVWQTQKTGAVARLTTCTL